MRFESPPCKPQWGGIFTRFEDPDGNSFGLAGFDESSGAAGESGVLVIVIRLPLFAERGIADEAASIA